MQLSEFVNRLHIMWPERFVGEAGDLMAAEVQRIFSGRTIEEIAKTWANLVDTWDKARAPMPADLRRFLPHRQIGVDKWPTQEDWVKIRKRADELTKQQMALEDIEAALAGYYLGVMRAHIERLAWMFAQKEWAGAADPAIAMNQYFKRGDHPDFVTGEDITRFKAIAESLRGLRPNRVPVPHVRPAAEEQVVVPE